MSCKKVYRCDCWIKSKPHVGSPEAHSVYSTKNKASSECHKIETSNYSPSQDPRECQIIN